MEAAKIELAGKEVTKRVRELEEVRRVYNRRAAGKDMLTLDPELSPDLRKLPVLETVHKTAKNVARHIPSSQAESNVNRSREYDKCIKKHSSETEISVELNKISERGLSHFICKHRRQKSVRKIV